MAKKVLVIDDEPEMLNLVKFTLEHGGGRMSAYVDASFPTAWREKRVYAHLKRWSAIQAQRNGQMLVFIGTKAIAILPDRDVELGDVNVEGKAIYYQMNRATGRIEVTVEG